MKHLLFILLFLTCHIFASSQVYVDANGYVRYQQPSPQVIHDTVVKTVIIRDTITKTVTVKDTVIYCPPVEQPPVVWEPVGAYTLVYSSGYNKLSDLTRDNGQYGNGTISTTIKTEGTGSFLSIPAGNTSNGFRSEDQFTDESKNVPMKEGAVEYDVMYQYFVANNSHSVQWHPFDNHASAALALWHKSGYLRFGRDINVGSANQFKPVLGKWYRFRIEFNFANSNGYARWYVDGKLQAEIKGLPVSSGGGQYFKLGQNNFNLNSEDGKGRVYYDNLKIYRKDNPPSPAPLPIADTVPQSKTYTIELSESDANTLLYILNKGKLDGISGEDATLVAVLIQRVTGQLRKQATGNK